MGQAWGKEAVQAEREAEELGCGDRNCSEGRKEVGRYQSLYFEVP